MNTAVGRRFCDGCTACCFTHAVAALKKQGGEWCSYCDIGKGCRIYRDRPEECRQFACLWLQGGWGDEYDRPDRLKVVVGKLAVNVGDRCIKLILFFETEAGAIEQERVASLIGMFRTQGSVIHIARLQLSGSYAGATYEIPTNLLSEQELELFELELSKLKLGAKPEQTKHDFELTHDDLETVSAGRIRFSPSPLDVKTSS